MYYKKKLQKYYEDRQRLKPVFTIIRARYPTISPPGPQDPSYQFNDKTDLTTLSDKEFLIELLTGIRQDIAKQKISYSKKSATELSLSRMLNHDFESEMVQIQSYQGLLA